MGWSRSQSEKKYIGKSSQNSPITVLTDILEYHTLCLYTLLEVVSYYDLSVVSVMGFGVSNEGSLVTIRLVALPP